MLEFVNEMMTVVYIYIYTCLHCYTCIDRQTGLYIHKCLYRSLNLFVHTYILASIVKLDQYNYGN